MLKVIGTNELSDHSSDQLRVSSSGVRRLSPPELSMLGIFKTLLLGKCSILADNRCFDGLPAIRTFELFLSS